MTATKQTKATEPKASEPKATEPEPAKIVPAVPTRWSRWNLPTWLVLTLMSVFLLLVAGSVWGIANTQSGCGFIDVAPSTDVMPWPCSPDATTPAIVTIWFIAVLLAAAFVVAFTMERRRSTVLLIIAGAMVLVAVIGALATFGAASAQPPIIDYWPSEDGTR